MYSALVTRVIDGDTLDVIIDLGFDLKLKRIVRLFGVNTPELHGPEAEKARKAKQRVEALVLNKTVVLHEHGTEKYGRTLAEIKVDGVDLSQILLTEGLAVPMMYVENCE